MTLKFSKFGSTCDIPENVLKEICKQGLSDMTVNLLDAKTKNELKRMGGGKNTRVTGIKITR